MYRDRLEYSNPRAELSKVVPLSTPYVVFVDPSGACNFRCIFCPCNNSDYKVKERHEIMSMELFYKIMTDLKEFPEQIKVINLYGFGDPLVNKHIVEMARYIKENSICRELRITTNGALLSHKMSEEFVEIGVDMIRFSIEALSDDEYKRVTCVDVDFEKLREQVEYLYCVSRGSNTIVSVKILNVALKDKSDADHFYDIFEPISDCSYIQDTTQAWAEFNAYVPENNYEAGNIGDMMDEDKICSFPLTNMAIHSNGSVGVCPQDWKFATEYGNVKESKLVDLWNSQKLFGIRSVHLKGLRHKLKYCKDCDVCVSNDDVRQSADVILKKLEETNKKQ